jgi:hypothetical protein
MLAPFLAKSKAIAFPIPLPPPVINAFFPSKYLIEIHSKIEL